MEREGYVLVERTASSQELERTRRWLSPTDFEGEGSEYRKHLNARLDGTGEWLRQSEKYRKWHDDDNRVGALWIQGIPGSGKSVIAANLIQTLRTEEVPVLFFFARRIIRSNSEPRNLLQDCLYQLLDHATSVQEKLTTVSEQYPDIDQVPFQDLWRVFLHGLSTLPRVYVVVDAIDELAVEKDDFLRLLRELGRSTKLIMTSRPEAHLLDGLIDPSTSVIRLTNRLVEGDISRYLLHRLDPQNVSLSSADKTALVEILCRKARGLFLYARLMLDQILQQPAPPSEVELQSLPESLEDMYIDLLQEHSTRSGAPRQFQHLLLSWITHASRPLRVTELAVLIDSDVKRCGLHEGQDAKVMVRTACGPLIEILDDETVQIIHHSFTECLLDTSRKTATDSDSSGRWFPAIDPSDAHRTLATRCVDYLSAGCFASWKDEEPQCWRRRRGLKRHHLATMVQFPLLHYASQNILYHAANYDSPDVDLIAKFDDFFRSGTHDFESWKNFWSAANNLETVDNVGPLHIAAQAGLTAYTQHLLAQDKNTLELADGNGRTALTYACMNGHARTLDVLLKHGAKFMEEDIYGLAPIHHAAKGNHAEVLQRLLNAGADGMSLVSKPRSDQPNYYDESGKTPIEYACDLGNTAAAVTLLDYVTPNQRGAVLPHWACSRGRLETLEALLKYPEIARNINTRDRCGNTALYLAAHGSYSNVVRRLLEHGADVAIKCLNVQDSVDDPSELEKGLWTPLHIWAKGQGRRNFSDAEFEGTGTLLVQAGCDVDARDDKGQTVLFRWPEIRGSVRGDPTRMERFVSLLLANGANPRVTDNEGNTPLHMPMREYSQSKDVIRAFVAAGADINHARDGDLVTPLMYVAMCQYTNGAAYLENGADANMRDVDGNTALHHICQGPRLKDMDLEPWLAFTDPNIKNLAGETCLYHMAQSRSGHNPDVSPLIALLLKGGLDLESRDKLGRTALLAACSEGDFDLIRTLIQHGADVKSRDFQNKTCLHLFAQSRRFSCMFTWHAAQFRDILNDLISAGLDINATDYNGDTPFHAAIVSPNDFHCTVKPTVEAIMQCGGVPNTQNHRGHTPLHALAADASKRGRREIAPFIQFLRGPGIEIDIHARDNEGRMAIHHAAAVSAEATWEFLEAGADLKTRADDGKGVLHYAAKAGQSNAVGLLCDLYKAESLPVDETDDHRRTPLHYAALSGCAESVDYLLCHGADPNARDRYGKTALHTATEYRPPVLVAYRSAKERLPHPSEASNGITMWLDSLDQFMDWEHFEAYKQEKCGTTVKPAEETFMIRDVIRLLLRAGSDPCIRDTRGQTAYDLAVLQRQEDIIDLILPSVQDSSEERSLVHDWLTVRSSSNVGIRTEQRVIAGDSYTRLLTAITLGSEHLLECLLHNGADPNIPGPDGLTPVHYVAHLGRVSMMESLIPHIKHWNAFVPPLLHIAASREQSNLGMVRLLVEQGVDVNAVYQKRQEPGDGETRPIPLYSVAHMLAIGGHWWNIQALDFLCRAGMDLELMDGYGNTPLHCALNGCGSGYEGAWAWQDECLDVMLRNGAKVDSLTAEEGMSPLTLALKRKGAKLIKKLLEYGADITAGTEPAIIRAVLSRDSEGVALILDAGADPNTIHTPVTTIRNGHGPKVETPILLSALNVGERRFEVAKAWASEEVMLLLLQRGADLLQALPHGTTVLHEICRYFGNIGPILERGGIDLEAVDSTGSTLLHCACSPKEDFTGYAKAPGPAQLLIRAGANVHEKDGDGRTPLHLAVRSGLADTIPLLREQGASISSVDSGGFTPLHYALSGDYPFTNQLLLIDALVADCGWLAHANPDGHTPLHLLAPHLMLLSPAGYDEEIQGIKTDETFFSRYQALYESFVENGWDRNARDKNGNTPLFAYVKAVKCESEYHIVPPPAECDVRKMFHDHDVFAVNENGDTLLHVVAAREEHPESVQDGLLLFKILLEKGLNPKQANTQGLSALDIAATCGRTEIVELFAIED